VRDPLVSASDLDWLGDRYPTLKLTATGGVAGPVDFSATYNRQQNMFQILYLGDEDIVGGLPLAGTFNISIEERQKDQDSPSRLPALRITGIIKNAHRHVSLDNSACLCSPFAERDFYTPYFAFRSYFEQLIIPFLYGQSYYQTEKGWPWDDYSHGTLGVLEAYKQAGDRADAEECLLQLRRDTVTWPRVRAVLTQHRAISDSTPCICKWHHRMARCHLSALRGLQQLRLDLRSMHVRV
jgi:hypothetical protein